MIHVHCTTDHVPLCAACSTRVRRNCSFIACIAENRLAEPVTFIFDTWTILSFNIGCIHGNSRPIFIVLFINFNPPNRMTKIPQWGTFHNYWRETWEGTIQSTILSTFFAVHS